MTDTDTLKALRERVAGLSGPDRGVDGLLARDLLGWVPHFDLDGDELLEWPVMGGHWNDDFLDPYFYTASIDAALGLVERVLPGKTVETFNDAAQMLAIEWWPGTEERSATFLEAFPLAVLLVLLDALIAQGTEAPKGEQE